RTRKKSSALVKSCLETGPTSPKHKIRSVHCQKVIRHVAYTAVVGLAISGNVFNSQFDRVSIPHVTSQVIEYSSKCSSISKKVQSKKIRTRRSNTSFRHSIKFFKNIILYISDHPRCFL